MPQSPKTGENFGHPSPGEVKVPEFVVKLEPWGATFLRNIREAIVPPPRIQYPYFPGAAWPDVLVYSPLPWRSVVQSVFFHGLFFLLFLGISVRWFLGMQSLHPQVAKDTSITYYKLSEYLPSLQGGSAPAKIARKGQPAYARQAIISLPPNPDNTSQTIVNPVAPAIMRQNVPLPNIVIWSPVPNAAPVAASARTAAQLKLPNLDTSSLTAVPVTNRQPSQLGLEKLGSTSVLQPPPELVKRRAGDLNIGHINTAVAAPALPVPEQRATAGGASGPDSAPPPAGASSRGSAATAAGQLIALGLNPVNPNGPIAIPQGSRSGTFAATPAGKPGAPGTPDLAGGGNGPGGTGRGSGGPGNGAGGTNPAGISITGGGPSTGIVGAAAPLRTAPAARNPVEEAARRKALMAAAMAPPRLGSVNPEDRGAQAPAYSASSDEGSYSGKKYYSLTLNMPNLTSIGGSWIIRFAELRATRDRGELTAPVALVKVDPAYPPDLIENEVEGTVVLYAIIRRDGTVSDVAVVEGIQERLDENAKSALSRWRFRPATRNGNPVDLEAMITIPFRPRHHKAF